LRQDDRKRLLLGIVSRFDRDNRCAGLLIPEGELAEFLAGSVFEALQKGFDRRCLAVMAFEVKIDACPEAVITQNRLEHAHDFCAFFVDGRRIEVVDFVVDARPDWVGEGACVFGKLVGFQKSDVSDALDGPGAHVGCEFLVPEYGQAFLEAKLKPVPAGNAVSGPVMEILVRDHGFNIGIVLICRRFRISQNIFVIEDVEALVLHGPHVEIGHGNDIEDVEVIFAPEHLFIPAHGSLQ